MAYTINKTDGSLLTEISDSAIDTTATDLTLIGKNVTGYGEYINENFVKLLENFASTSEPNNPITGQLWFDQTDDRIKVYDGNGFIIAAGPIVSGTPPLTPNQGDFWIDNIEKKLYFYDGTRSRWDASKIWANSQGRSGFIVETLSDTLGNFDKVVTLLYNGGTLIGIFSHHEEFTPSANTPQDIKQKFPTIKSGFNVSSSLTNFKIYTDVLSASFLKDDDGQLIPPEDILIFNRPNNLTETLTISNSLPLILGAGAESSIIVDAGQTEIRNQIGQNFKITSLDNLNPSLYIKPSTNKVGIFNNDPQAALDVNGDVIISGNLTVNGSTTTINTTDLSVEDKNIILAAGSILDSTASGGGLTLKGLTEKTFNWLSTTESWTSSENIDLAAGKSYKIDGDDILSETTLSSTVQSALGLTYVGRLDSLQIGRIINPDFYLEIADGTISTSTDLTLTLDSGTSIISVSDKRLTNLADPIFDSDAVNKKYLENFSIKPWEFVGLPTASSLKFAENNDRLLVDTISSSAVVSLPKELPGTSVRFIDYNGSFASNPLTIVRYREVNWNDAMVPVHGTSSSVVGTYDLLSTTTDGNGSGLSLTITTTQPNTSYLELNTTIEVINPGIGYRSGDMIIVSGEDLGGTSPANDLIFRLQLTPILGKDDDLVVSIPNSAFSLVYTSPSQGWQYADSTTIPLRTPSYTTAERNARVMTSLNYGEIIYNTTDNKIQAYISPGQWVNLH